MLRAPRHQGWGTSSGSNVQRPKEQATDSVGSVDISVYAMPTITSASAPLMAAPTATVKRVEAARRAVATTITAVAGLDPDSPSRRLDTYA